MFGHSIGLVKPSKQKNNVHARKYTEGSTNKITRKYSDVTYFERVGKGTLGHNQDVHHTENVEGGRKTFYIYIVVNLQTKFNQVYVMLGAVPIHG